LAIDENAAYRGTMAPKHAVDLPRLEAWLTAYVEGFRGPVSVEQFRGGQSNPTYRLASPSGTYVLRRKPPGPLLPSAHAVDREFRVLKALGPTPVPVARVYALCEDDSVIGSSFYVMEFVDGRVFWQQSLPEATRAERAAIFDSMNAGIAALHSVDPVAAGLETYGKFGGFVARQVALWTRQYRASETVDIPAMNALIDWLPKNLPPDNETRIVHGDYRMDNIIFHRTEPRAVAILDWELSTLGDPVADFAYHMMSWRIAPGSFRGLGGLDLPALGIPTEDEYKAAYCRRTGRTGLDHWDFYIAFGMFRLSAIFQGIAKRALDGTASNVDALEVGKKAIPMAEMAWETARQLG
jgi:aminoglycoside phosphotransferase (APT) family kinase protein